MFKNANLSNAKKAKDDEFYTLLADIESEMSYYEEWLTGKRVLCNCDDPARSSFWKYFEQNFDSIGLDGLAAVYYDPEKTVHMHEIRKDHQTGLKTGTTIIPMAGDGDFRSQESTDLLERYDAVITNPPFSMAREYIGHLIRHKKRFAVISSMNSIATRDIFPLLKDGQMWIGHTNPKQFLQPNGTLKSFGNILWYTNIDTGRRRDPLVLSKRYGDDPSAYPRYDNYDAINVDRISDIPYDYDGVMGVPITFLYKHCPEQFGIIGITKPSIDDSLRTKVYPRQIQHCPNKALDVTKLNDGAAILLPERPKRYPYYEIDGQYYRQVYPRILIRRKAGGS